MTIKTENMGWNLKGTAKRFENQFKQIKLALFDVDGILTDGKVFWQGEEVGFNRFFHVRDGYGLKLLKMAGIEVGIITGGNSRGLKERFKQLGIDNFYYGKEDKRSAYLELQQKYEYTDSQILYMGDEYFDLPLLKKAGFSATVPSASLAIQESCDYITEKSAGDGAAREVIDLLLRVQEFTPDIPDFQ